MGGHQIQDLACSRCAGDWSGDGRIGNRCLASVSFGQLAGRYAVCDDLRPLDILVKSFGQSSRHRSIAGVIVALSEAAESVWRLLSCERPTVKQHHGAEGKWSSERGEAQSRAEPLCIRFGAGLLRPKGPEVTIFVPLLTFGMLLKFGDLGAPDHHRLVLRQTKIEMWNQQRWQSPYHRAACHASRVEIDEWRLRL